ncbi:MAG: trypsin-like peptidase domain-containing protein [Actinobacteria bacterium]|nr:trypsin-like peptidase domain-containing protein [Actinomycetota bacterium]
MEDETGTRSFFLKGIVIILVAIIFFIIGSLFSLAALSVIYKTTPLELLKENISGKISSELGEKGKSKFGALDSFDEAVNTIAEEVLPSVVNIRVRIVQEDMFGNKQTGEGVGSGIVYKEDGYIITNNHVVGGVAGIIVTLSDGKEFPAELVGADTNTDIAVIKINAKGLKPAVFTSIENVKIGQIAIALGSPFGLQKSVTMGVISALGRDIPAIGGTIPMVGLLQTDATINPGNSGGPLVNSAGQVMGINTIIFSPSGASAGVGFAIPSDIAVNIARQIIKFGKAKIPFIGIEMGVNNTEIKGVYISKVTKGYPAEKAGLAAGDIITEFGGVKVENPYQLLAKILSYNVGDKIELIFYRNGSYTSTSVLLVEKPEIVPSQ